MACADEVLVTDAVRDALPPEVVTRDRPDVVPVRRIGGELRIWEVLA